MEVRAIVFPRRSVLVVDRSQETREVLRMALAGSGTHVLEASRPDEGLRLAREHHPDVIVLDLDVAAESGEGIAADFDAESQARETALVLLGSARRTRKGFHAGQFVSKPYHYGPLIRKIEGLLDEARQPPLPSA
jgi:DNA-binding response OmpR family regulator